jgi:hypothetical protein
MFRALPDKTLTMRNDKCLGVKFRNNAWRFCCVRTC